MRTSSLTKCHRGLVAAIAVTFVGACAGEETSVEDPGSQITPVKELPQPRLRMVGPSGLSAGDPVTLMGEGFATPDVGRTLVTFEGTYQGASGAARSVQLEVEPRFVNQGVLEWTFGPNIPFADPVNQETGIFRGIIQAVNVGLDGQRKPAPAPLSAELQVQPSIIILQLRPPTAGCAPGMTATTESTRLLFELQVVGLRASTQTAPMQFVYSFLQSNFRFSDGVSVNPESLFPETGPLSIIDVVTQGDISRIGTGAGRKVRVERGDYTSGGLTQALSGLVESTQNLFDLTWLETAPLPNATANYYDAVVNVLAVDGEGMQARRSIPLRVWSPIEIDYDGNSEVVRSFDPIPVTGCIPGGYIGRDVTYEEQNEERRVRSLSVNGKVGAEINAWVAKASLAFGLEVNSSVSSADSRSLNIVGKILPREFGAFYRQTLQLQRRAQLKGHGPCGHVQGLGEVILTDWVWSPDLAKSRQCPPLPVSNLAPGQVFSPNALR